MNQRIFREYVKTMLIAAGAAAVVIAAINVIGDPYRAFNVVRWERIDQGRRKDGDRASKAEMLMRGNWQAVFVGDSRVEVGLDPAHEALGGLRTYNAGLSGATWIETMAAGELALRENRELKLMVVMADFERFWRNEAAGPDFANTPFDEKTSMLEYRMGTLLGMGATNHAVSVLSTAVKNKDRRQRVNGLLIRHADQVKIDYEAMFRGGLSVKMELSEDVPGEAAAMFERLRDECRARGVRLVVVTPAYHALVVERWKRAGVWEQYAKWMRTMSELCEVDGVEFWDWAGCDGAQAERVPAKGEGRHMRWYFETVHFAKELGDAKLGATLAGREEANVVRVRAENVEKRLRDLREELAGYEREHAEEVARFFGAAGPVAGDAGSGDDAGLGSERGDAERTPGAGDAGLGRE